MDVLLSKELKGGIGAAYDRTRDRLLVAEFAGSLAAVDDGGRTQIGRGYAKPEDIVVSAAGRFAVVSERGGDVLLVSMTSPDRANARVLASGLRAPHQLALDEDAGLVYVVEHTRADGRLLAIPLRTRRPTVGRGGRPGILLPRRPRTIVSGLTAAVGLVLDRERTTAYITEQTRGSGRIVAIALDSGTRRTVTTGLVNPFMLTWQDGGESTLLVAERDPANRVSAVPIRRRGLGLPTTTVFNLPFIGRLPDRFGTGRLPRPFPRPSLLTTPRTLIDGVAFRPSSVAVRPDGRVYVISDKEVMLYDLTPQPTLRVELDIDPEPMFVGAYQRVGVRIIGSGASFDDLEIDVAEGPKGGVVSMSHDATFDPSDPHVMLLGGFRPGSWTLRATQRTTGDVLGTAAFVTTDLWRGVDGPPLWFEGVSQDDVLGAAWGGGPAGPQNVDVKPASGTRNVALLFVDTASARYPADTSAIQNEWTNETFNGVTVGGKTVSAHHYFQELSRGTFGLVNGGVAGPVQLSGDFEDYFEWTGTVWRFKTAFPQSAITAADALLDFTDIETVVFIVRTAPPADPTSTEEEETVTRMAWPYGWGSTFTTAEGNKAIKTVVMPADWEAFDVRELYETLTHELGHNLGLPDLYMKAATHGAIAAREVSGWDVMSRENRWGHMTAPNKMQLGWIRPEWVKSFDFAGSGAVDQTVTLRANELGAPGAGEFSAVEIRLADGWNYYFEYRAEQPTQIGSQQLESDRHIIGTDMLSDTSTAPVVRRQIILLPDDVDGDGPIIDTGEDYEETDVTDPMFPTDFKVDVVSIDGDTADIRIRYGASSRPDPSLRPWPGSGTNAWQSPDIEVRNGKNAADASMINLPWTGHPNTIVAKVRNTGSLLAQGVQVNFGVKDFNAGGGSEAFLGTRTVDIPAGATVEVEFDGWVPPEGGHFCVVARLPLHIETGPPVIVEMTELNNLAQSNYTEFISATASPATRERTFVTVGNPYPKRTRVFLEPAQTNPFFRTYVGATSLELDPGEERKVEVMFESIHGTPEANMVFEKFPDKEEFFRSPNIVNLSATIEDPRDDEVHTTHALGGVIARVRSGIKTTVDGGADGNTVFGRVIAADKSVINGGQVIVTARVPGDPMSEVTGTGTVTNGSYAASLPRDLFDEPLELTAEYLGDGRWAPSKPIRFTAQ
ncbi:MAG: M6 family metalloprotease-like protein [Nitriliruptoraceae bacterium]|jgi:M6 family metalloprotease-like protein